MYQALKPFHMCKGRSYSTSFEIFALYRKKVQFTLTYSIVTPAWKTLHRANIGPRYITGLSLKKCLEEVGIKDRPVLSQESWHRGK